MSAKADIRPGMEGKQSWITTRSGRRFSYLNPTLDQIYIGDIAVALSRAPRFAGHSRVFYSVAEHSLHVSYLVEQMGGNPLQALLHDAAEAYMCDLPAPLKSLLPGYKTIEKGVLDAIMDKYSQPHVLEPHVKEADVQMVFYEGSQLTEGEWHMPGKFHPFFYGYSLMLFTPEAAHEAFLQRFVSLYGGPSVAH